MVAPTTATPATTVVRFSSSETKATMSSMCAAASRLERPAPPTARPGGRREQTDRFGSRAMRSGSRSFIDGVCRHAFEQTKRCRAKPEFMSFFGRFELLTPSPTS